jgi:hypothetical protein
MPHGRGILGLMALQKKWILLGMSAFLATAFGLFVLPFLLPPAPLTAISAANTAGFNNRVAAYAAAMISLGILLIALRLDLRLRLPRAQDCAQMSRVFVWRWALLMGAITTVLAVLIYQSRLRYEVDLGYFIEQMTKVADYNRQLYSQVEFPYGPLLFYPTIWMRGFFRSMWYPMEASYIWTLFLNIVLGLLLVAYSLERLPIANWLRRATFVCFAIFGFNLGFGLNYTYFRFAIPLASLLFCLRPRQVWKVFVLVVLGEVLNLGVSPEMGFSFACGAVAFSGLQAWRQRNAAWLSISLGVLLAGVIFVSLVGRTYFTMLSQFSGGAFNLIVEPQPYVLFFLVALVWLAPLAVATAWRTERDDAVLLSTVFISGLALLPVCFGRADAGHVVYNGIAILFLALIPVSTWRISAQRAWIAAMFLAIGISQVIFLISSQYRMRAVLDTLLLRSAPVRVRSALLRIHTPKTPGAAERFLAVHSESTPPFDINRLRELTGGEVVATPFNATLAIEHDLRAHNMYFPEMYMSVIGVLGPSAERRKIQEINSQRWLLMGNDADGQFTETPENTRQYLGIGFPYASHRKPYSCGVLMAENLKKNWEPVALFDELTLYRRRW